MTPFDKTKLKDSAQMRAMFNFTAEPITEPRIKSDFYVEGYATTFEPYVLFEDGEQPIYEEFRKENFIGCDISDVIFQFDHSNKVFARTSNGTLIVEPDENGLFVAADLSKSKAARELYEEIKAGLITKMSWRFSFDEREFDNDRKTITYKKIKKIYDVSAVSIPSNNDTVINARSFVNGVIDEIARRDAELEDKRRRLRIKINLTKEV